MTAPILPAPPRSAAVALTSSIPAEPNQENARVPPAVILEGPHVMYVQQLKQWRLVCDVEKNVPFVWIDGKREASVSNLRDFGDPATPSLNGNGVRLQPARHFFPGLVKVENIATQIGANHLSFRATFDSVSPLDHVYFAFEIITKTDHHVFCLEELGKLTPHHRKPVTEKLLLPNYVEIKSCKIYLFTGGVEIMHTEMTQEEIEHGFNDLVSYQLQRAPEEQPAALLAATPDYPAEMREKKISGTTTLTVRVSERGRIENPQVVHASHPAFAAAALKVVGDWRFIPAVRNGRPIASTIDLPFTFSP